MEEEESVVFLNIEVRVKRTGPSGLGDLEVTEYIARIRSRPFERERTAHLSTWQRLKQDSCLTNSFIVPLTCYLYLSHLIKSLYMFMLCFANYMYIVYISGARHDAHAYS